MATMEAYSAELQKMLFSDGLKKLGGGIAGSSISI